MTLQARRTTHLPRTRKIVYFRFWQLEKSTRFIFVRQFRRSKSRDAAETTADRGQAACLAERISSMTTTRVCDRSRNTRLLFVVQVEL